MKRLFYILTSLLVLSSCTDELSVSNEYLDIREGENVKVQFSINAPEEGIAETRTLGDFGETGVTAQKDLNLWLFVFDKNGVFVQAAEATLGDNSTDGSHTDTQFTVTLNATSSQRIIHFIAFDNTAGEHSLANQIATAMNQFGTEATMITKLFATAGQAAYWQRIVVNRIEEGPLATDGCVPLVRNFAKVSVAKNTSITDAVFKLEGFTIINVPDRGTIAPFKGGFVEYVTAEKTQKSYQTLSGNTIGYEGSTPAGTTYSTPEITTGDNGNESTIITKNPHYLYETPNSSGDAKGRTALIVKGKYKNGRTSSYYKVDLIYDNPQDDAAGHLFYNILRNFEYKVTINEVTGNGHASFAEALASAASNNLSASTSTASLTRISDGKQMLEVTNTYFMFTKSGVQKVFKYRYQYYDGTKWIVNNNLINLTNSDNALFSTDGRPTIASADDPAGTEYAGWRTVTMDLKSPTGATQTSNIHLYASRSRIEQAGLSNTINGELLYRDVRVDLRNPYKLVVAPQSYVAPTPETKFRVDLLIPQGVNEALFPMDFYIEAKDKYISPDATNAIKLPVHVGQSIVQGKNDASFQYTRTVTKADYAILGTKTVDGTTYKVIPCYFKTNVAASATTVYAYNEYFNTGSKAFSNIPVAFPDDTSLTISAGDVDLTGSVNVGSNNQETWVVNPTVSVTQMYGRGYPVTLTFYVTADVFNDDDTTTNTTFSISVTEGGVTTTGTASLSKDTSDTDTYGNTIYKQSYTYYTQTINGASIVPTITATFGNGIKGAVQETKTASLTMNRRYFVIGKNSFTNNVSEFSKESSKEDGSLIYIDDVYVGWFGRQWNNVAGHSYTEGFINNNGPKDGYVIDRSFQNYAPLTEGALVRFEVNKFEQAYVETTIGALDNAAIKADDTRYYKPAEEADKLVLTFSDHSTNP